MHDTRVEPRIESPAHHILDVLEQRRTVTVAGREEGGVEKVMNEKEDEGGEKEGKNEEKDRKRRETERRGEEREEMREDLE